MSKQSAGAWVVAATDYPAVGPDADKLRHLLRYAILAPSSHNTQPWLFRVAGNHVDVIADRSRALPVVDPRDRELVISCGAALGVMRTCLRHFGSSGDIELFPNGDGSDLLARVGLGQPHEPAAADHARFDAITRRRSTRRKFKEEALPPGLADELQELAEADGIELVLITGAEMKRNIAGLIAEADREQYRNPDFRKELARWLHSRRSSSHDGMSLASYGAPDILSGMARSIIRTFDVGGGVAASDQQIAAGSPALIVIATAQDEPHDWIAAGLMHMTALLAVTARGLTADYLNQPIEVATMRPRLRSLLGVSGHPQLLFRIGRGPEVAPAVRRPLEEVLLGR
ncbi:nitroreductase [Proteobacteria bacterium 005FR1]|nr:nitroreductase [Proteobacteria bacterium 005FR1]